MPTREEVLEQQVKDKDADRAVIHLERLIALELTRVETIIAEAVKAGADRDDVVGEEWVEVFYRLPKVFADWSVKIHGISPGRARAFGIVLALNRLSGFLADLKQILRYSDNGDG